MLLLPSELLVLRSVLLKNGWTWAGSWAWWSLNPSSWEAEAEGRIWVQGELDHVCLERHNLYLRKNKKEEGHDGGRRRKREGKKIVYLAHIPFHRGESIFSNFPRTTPNPQSKSRAGAERSLESVSSLDLVNFQHLVRLSDSCWYSLCCQMVNVFPLSF